MLNRFLSMTWIGRGSGAICILAVACVVVVVVATVNVTGIAPSLSLSPAETVSGSLLEEEEYGSLSGMTLQN